MGRRLDVATLGLSQIIGYGTLYYGFATLAPSVARDFGWPVDRVFGALSVALLIGGLVAPWSGRSIDRFGAARVMSGGSVMAAVALVACAAAQNGWVFVAALTFGQVAATMVQYSAAFPLLVQRHAITAQRSIVHLTLIAGFASTLFWPLTTWLHGMIGWRWVYVVFALLHLVVCLPIHLRLSRPIAPAVPPHVGPDGGAPVSGARVGGGRLTRQSRHVGFVLMGTAFALQSFVGAAVLVHMLPMLDALGLGLAGIAVGTLFGPAQVASRLVNMIFGRELPQTTLALISAILSPAAVALLLTTAPSYTGAMLFAVLFGMSNGLFSIVGGTLPLALFGVDGYGALQGRITAIRLGVGAAAPFVFALLTEQFGVRAALIATVVAGGGAAMSLVAVARLVARAPHASPAVSPSRDLEMSRAVAPPATGASDVAPSLTKGIPCPPSNAT